MKTVEQPWNATGSLPHPHAATQGSLSRSAKIEGLHLAKLAVVYIRQSSPHQVLENRESTARQYELAKHATALGWPAERVLVIDEDQGRSGRSAAWRVGFQRLLAEVTMDHVGIILGLEMSRLARLDSDWHHLLEVCGVFGTLLADQDGVYDAADPNDRLLLGLKGTISSVELATMRNRLEKGRLSKARRGELFWCAPLGYVRVSTSQIDLDPDEEARSVVHLLFEKFEELRTVRSLFHWLLDHGISLPIRPRTGPRQGQLGWRRPTQATLREVFHHPIYAGAYAYGRRPVDPKRQYATGKSRRRNLLPMDQWQVLILNHLPAYITWEQFLRNQERLKQNQSRPDTLGAPRNGSALLGGVIVCGRCRWRMAVSYRDREQPSYRCVRSRVEGTQPPCLSVAAPVLDALVAQQVLRALEPAALEASLQAQADVHKERERLDRHWRQKLQRAQYDVDLAERRYRAIDPDNRLVAASLERQWEAALRSQRETQEEYDRFAREALPQLGVEEAARIAALASDIPALWSSPHTTNADRQAILRCLVERVVVEGERKSERVTATIHWAGGSESRLEFVRPVRSYEHLSAGDALRKRLEELREAGKSAAQTAVILNAEGFSPVDPRDRFTRTMVRDLLVKLGLHGEKGDDSLLSAGEWWISDLAQAIGMPWMTLRGWALNGWVHGRQTKVQKLWILWADEEEVERLRRLRSAGTRVFLGYPKELTTPKPRPISR